MILGLCSLSFGAYNVSFTGNGRSGNGTYTVLELRAAGTKELELLLIKRRTSTSGLV